MILVSEIFTWSRVSRGIAVCISLVSIAGCVTVGPDYNLPETDAPDAWNQAVVGDLQTSSSNVHQWWSTFDDPTLTALIERAASGNLGARTALARIDESRAQLGIARGERFPDVDGAATVQRLRTSEGVSPALPSNRSRTDTLYQVGGDAIWEADLWGRIRRNVESAQASYDAAQEDYRDVLVSLYAEIATNYINARNLQERIALAESNVVAQRASVELTRDRQAAGLVGMLDVRQAELNLAITESSVPQFRAAYVQAVNRLGVLLGEFPSALHAELGGGSIATPNASPGVVDMVPADMLRQRPDVRAAERRLAAQNARIGAQQALLYPTFSLVGSLTLEAFDSSDVFESGSRSYGFGPSVRWNLFDGKRIRSAVDAERARTEAALLQYEQTVLIALEEAESSMVALAQEQDRLVALERASTAAGQSVELVQTLYRTGLTDFQNVLDMQRAKFAQDDAFAVSKGQLALNLVRVYEAMGGGWQLPSDSQNQDSSEE